MQPCQVRGDGQPIAESDQQYFWHPHYMPVILYVYTTWNNNLFRPTGDSIMPPVLSIERPLSARWFQKLCATG